MTVWLVRGGKYGQYEEVLLQENITSFGWIDLPDLSKITTKEELKEIYLKFYFTEIKMRMANQVGQIWSFLKKIKVGDLVALPLKGQSLIVIGEITGDYKYNPDSIMKHQRSVKWIKNISRSEFDQDILFSLGAFLTVGRVRREKADERILMLLKEKTNISSANEIDNIEENISHDYLQIMKDDIAKFLKINFSGHQLAALIDEILQAKGFVTKVSPPGPDGGVDILAGSGPLGFESPRICVQVKSSDTSGDVRIVRELVGVVSHFNADYGLLVAWGGLNKKAQQEIKSSFFSTKIWDQGKIVNEIMLNYEKFSEEFKANLPLKRTWVLVQESDE